jgi:hypothetical protein
VVVLVLRQLWKDFVGLDQVEVIVVLVHLASKLLVHHFHLVVYRRLLLGMIWFTLVRLRRAVLVA